MISVMSNNCYTCELTAKRKSGEAPLWDNIYQTDYWDVVHAYNSTLAGWMVLVSRRHIEALDEMSEGEAVEVGSLIRRVSVALKQVVGCAKTYVIQFAEHPQHPHVHFHIVPRMADQPDERRSTKIFGYLGASEDERIDETMMNELGLQIREILMSEDT